MLLNWNILRNVLSCFWRKRDATRLPTTEGKLRVTYLPQSVIVTYLPQSMIVTCLPQSSLCQLTSYPNSVTVSFCVSLRENLVHCEMLTHHDRLYTVSASDWEEKVQEGEGDRGRERQRDVMSAHRHLTPFNYWYNLIQLLFTFCNLATYKKLYYL